MEKQSDRSQIFYRIISSAIRLLLAGVVFLLLLHSVYSTSFVGRIFLEDGAEQERTLNIADSPLKHLLVFVFFTAALLAVRFLWRRIKPRFSMGEAGKPYRAVCGKLPFWGLTALTLILGVVYVGMTQFYPGSDPAKIFRIAMEWRQGDFSAFEEGGYLFRYPFQSAIVMYFYLLSFLFGEGNYVGPQLLNVVFLAVIYGLLAKLSGLFGISGGETGERFGAKRMGLQTAVYAALLVWTPLSFYVTYLYGILPGMALSLAAVYFTQRYFSCGKYRYIAAACVCMGLATVIKMNCLIYLIAIICFLAYDMIVLLLLPKEKRQRQWGVSAIFIVCMGLSAVLCSQLTDRIVEAKIGQELPEGEVYLSWVTMGMQEAPLGPGGYNGFTGNVFTEYHYDTEKITQVSIEELQRIAKRMAENPLDEGVTFLARKTAFQWNDPTFLCLDSTRRRKTEVRVPQWLNSVINGRGSVRFSVVLNYMQTLILLGMLLYLFLRRKKGSMYELMGAVVFLGGYLFHLFWQASASYTIPYFTLLIPYAVCGMAEWAAFLERGAGRLRRTDEAVIRADESGQASVQTARGKRLVKILTIVMGLGFCLLVLAFTRTNLFNRTIALNDDLQEIDASDQFYQRGEWEKGY